MRSLSPGLIVNKLHDSRTMGRLAYNRMAAGQPVAGGDPRGSCVRATLAPAGVVAAGPLAAAEAPGLTVELHAVKMSSAVADSDSNLRRVATMLVFLLNVHPGSAARTMPDRRLDGALVMGDRTTPSPLGRHEG